MATIGSMVVSVNADASGFGKEMKKAKAEVSEFAKLAGTAMKADFLLKGIGQALRFAEKMPDISAGLAGWANQMTGSSWFDPEKITMGFKAIVLGQDAVHRYNIARENTKRIEANRLIQLEEQNEKLRRQQKAADHMNSTFESLEKQVAQFDMDDIAKTIDDARRAGVTNPVVLNEIEEQARILNNLKAEAKWREEVDAAVDEFNKQMQEFDAAEKSEAAAKAQEKLNAEFEDTRRLLEGLMTPADKFAEEVARINELFEAGNFDQATFEALIGKAGEGLGDKSKQEAVRGSAALARGSSGAVSAINAFRDQGRAAKADDPQKKLVAEAIKAAKDRERANKLLADIAAKLDDPVNDPDLAVVEF